jgi:hypothetical protein
MVETANANTLLRLKSGVLGLCSGYAENKGGNRDHD